MVKDKPLLAPGAGAPSPGKAKPLARLAPGSGAAPGPVDPANPFRDGGAAAGDPCPELRALRRLAGRA